MKSNGVSLNVVVGLVVLLIVFMTLALGAPILFPDRAQAISPELLMSIAIVLAVAVMMALLFAFAAAFSALGLATKEHALGLPEGSIRAMIALVLIMVFIIFDIYLFRAVGQGTEGITILDSMEQVDRFGDAAEILSVVPLADGRISVAFRRPIDQEGTRLAQQVVTTVGTLVVAVAGFYFGSSSVSGAAAAIRTSGGSTNVPGPVIVDFEPKTGQQNQTIDLKIQGRRLRDCRAVRLERGDTTMANLGDVTSSETEATCRIVLNGAAGGDKWDLVVENVNGQIDVLPKAFEVTS